MENIILETEENSSSRGRKGTKLSINYDYKDVIGRKRKRGTRIGSLNSLDGVSLENLTLKIPEKSQKLLLI